MKELKSSQPVKAGIRKYLESKLFKIQLFICGHLNTVTKGWSTRTIRLYWIFFILVGTGISLEIFGEAFIKQKAFPYPGEKIRAINMPLVISGQNIERQRANYLKVKSYRVYIDNLRKGDSINYHRLMNLYPHLEDSIALLQITLSQNIKK